MTPDNEPVPLSDEEFGIQLHDELTEEYGLETEAWATERLERVVARLNAVRERCPYPGACPVPLRAEILWVGEMNAFAAPGRWVYITRELLQQFCADEPVALVIAHEMAHHDLGHVRLLSSTVAKGLRRRLPNSAAFSLTLLWKAARKTLYSSEWETAADIYSLDLCIAAGYAPRPCLELFHALEHHLLNHRDIEGVFGPDSRPSDNSDTMLHRLKCAGQDELWRRARGYPSLRARRAALLSRIADYERP